MKCQACGAGNSDEASFCQKCGAPLAGHPPGGPANARHTAADGLRAAATIAGKGSEAEEKLWTGGFSAKAMLGTWFAALALTLALIVLSVLLPIPVLPFVVGGVVFLLWIYAIGAFVVRRLSVHYTLTNQRFLHESGLFTRTTDRIEVIDIDDVTFRQGVVERALGVGTIEIESSDRTHPRLVLAGIDNVKVVAGMIDDVRRKERRRRGIHIEQV
ncbi:MAG: PH domain-containing protein [Planctomycetota bacterium]